MNFLVKILYKAR